MEHACSAKQQPSTWLPLHSPCDQAAALSLGCECDLATVKCHRKGPRCHCVHDSRRCLYLNDRLHHHSWNSADTAGTRDCIAARQHSRCAKATTPTPNMLQPACVCLCWRNLLDTLMSNAFHKGPAGRCDGSCFVITRLSADGNT
eukprot:CAMPEP_0183357240 /NCGR_PEP_ID=MMETSP0164_2-20130417/45680_1 /TAXON_ID=221442 /ORGANISM="Coccolithus pelagicus ssp braarudi, Strain PLY182g" /LENGTH=144 /DNA_ID=CAMNT_0025530817 /DNA_START=343 /DNA_END=773 /DNA_ORIENTATION=+